MPWTCKLVTREEVTEKYDKMEPIPIGWMWFLEMKDVAEGTLSNYYKEHNQANRLPLLVELPDGAWCMDGIASRDATKKGWIVTGEPPNITVSPSINSSPGYPDGYHGWLQNGVISDDLEGRTYGNNNS